jgi:hypothetical protein
VTAQQDDFFSSSEAPKQSLDLACGLGWCARKRKSGFD